MRIFKFLSLLLFTTNLFAQIGDKVFDETKIHEIYVNVPYDGLVDTLREKKYSGVYTKCNVVFDGSRLPSTGIKFKGYFSYNYANTSDKKPIKLDFSEFVEDQKHDGLTKVNLVNGFSDPSFLRDAISYKLLRESGIPAPRTAFAKFYLNNTYFGLYLMVEEIDKRFLEKNNFPDKNGNLYKAGFAGLTYNGEKKEDYIHNFEQQQKYKGDTTWNDVIKLHKIVNDSSSNFYPNLLKNFQVENFLGSMAVDFIVANWDSFLGHERNYSLYHSPTTDKFYWLPWDYNFAFSDAEGTSFDNLYWKGQTENVFWKNCMNTPTLKTQYLENVCFVNSRLTLEKLEPYIENMRKLILPALTADPNKHYPVDKFNEGIDSNRVIVQEILSSTIGLEDRTYAGLKYMIARRHFVVDSLLTAEKANCKILGKENSEELQLRVFPNPTNERLFFENPFQGKTVVEVFGTDGRLVYSQTTSESKHSIATHHFSTGLYIIRVSNAQKSLQQRFYKE